MPVHALFPNAEPLREWIRQGAPIPDVPAFTHYGSGEQPQRSVRNEISNQAAYAKFLEQGGPVLYADWGRLDVSELGWNPAQLTFWEYESDSFEVRNGVLANALTLFRFLDQFRPYYGAAYDFEEWSERHLYKYQSSWSHRPSTSPIGKDVNKYIPGLYWMTCFSQQVLGRHGVSLEGVRAALGGELHTFANSTILQLFDRPYAWPDRHPGIARFLAETPGFFSMSKVEVLPEGLGMREFMGEFQRVTRAWP